MAHYADHCAICHGNDGSGDTMLGNGMYPRPPDMRLAATQGKTDGELFSIIENGIRLSGMPAFGGNASGAADSWKLVLFLRHLPRLTPEELADMQALNPKGPDELEEEKREADFLNGASATGTKSQ
jgi:mono/diheme cytochrome c family protein